MSEAESFTENAQIPVSKHNKLERSCDFCRRRKSNGPNMPDKQCSRCLAFGGTCTYNDPYQKRGPKNATVEGLMKEVASLKAKLRTLSFCSLCAQPLHSQGDGRSENPSVFPLGSPNSDTTTIVEELPPEDPGNYIGQELASRFRQFSITTMKNKYFGSAGSFALANSAMALKEKYVGRSMMQQTRRSLYWDVLPWEKETYNKRACYVYPDSDLLAALMDLYFTLVHPTVPILHRPSFEKSVADGLHLSNMEFGGLLLSVLAVASRYSNDPRVFVEGHLLSAGWKFASQLEMIRKMFEPTIYEVQMYCLMAIYSLGTSLPQFSWLYLGIGIRFLQQRGEHRRKRDLNNLNFEDEVWKKVSFVCLDSNICVFLGWPMGLHGEDCDVDLPLDVDDEYWDVGFKQPPEKPALISYFVCHSRLCEILGDALRRLYGSRKAKLQMGWNGSEWEQRTTSTLDSAMNDFSDMIPLHLRWNPESPPQGVFFDQSALLYLNYQHVLIAIHRPCLQKAGAPVAPSLSICTRAARAIIHTADMWLRKLQRLPPPNILVRRYLHPLVLGLLSSQLRTPCSSRLSC
ncbi:fungal-specific transcription factor domain-containing protein [Mycena filopes]|nr:fungal-specific transcription factor domain-containing protein [Mycena filopes]